MKHSSQRKTRNLEEE